MVLPVQLAPNPYPYLVEPIRRETHGPRLYWLDGETKRYITVDVVPSLEYTQSSTATEFPVQDGTVYSDHIQHFPDYLKLEIVQTNQPFEDADDAGKIQQFPVEDLTLNLPKTSFRPTGLLALSLLGEQAVGAVVSAVAGVFGVGAELGMGATKIGVAKNPNVRDRINELIDKLTACRLEGRLLSLDWLGRVWTNLAIENIAYKRTTGTTKGSISLALKQINTTTTDTAALPNPAELRLQPETNGGQKPAKTPSAPEQAEADENGRSVLSHVFY